MMVDTFKTIKIILVSTKSYTSWYHLKYLTYREYICNNNDCGNKNDFMQAKQRTWKVQGQKYVLWMDIRDLPLKTIISKQKFKGKQNVNEL